jgi:hypothetical protein
VVFISLRRETTPAKLESKYRGNIVAGGFTDTQVGPLEEHFTAYTYLSIPLGNVSSTAWESSSQGTVNSTMWDRHRKITSFKADQRSRTPSSLHAEIDL